MSEAMHSPVSQLVDGFRLPAGFSADNYRSAVRYKPRDDDVFIVTYPKCGTTWTANILLLLFRNGKPVESHAEFLRAAPFIFVTGVEAAEAMPRPGPLLYHFPFHLTPWSDKAKYIYVARNPKDCCVSFYHHMKDFRRHGLKWTFDQFFELFLSGNIDYGDYFDNLMGWYEHRNDPNVLFVTFEAMKENPESSVLKLASFIDEEKYAKPLREDPEKLQNILKYSSFEYMKETSNKGLSELFRIPKDEDRKSDLPEDMKKIITTLYQREAPVINFVRKGIVGDWKNFFNEDQSRRLDLKFSKRTKGTELPSLWKNHM